MQEKLTGKERTALLYLAALDDEIHKASPILRERLRKTSPTGWRDMADISRMAARQTCGLCMKGRREAQGCKLRKCLQSIAPMPDGDMLPDELFCCEYAQVDWEGEA